MRRFFPKELGEKAEARFLCVAVSLSFIVAKLWGDSRPYLAWQNNSRPYRIQVKAPSARKGGGYQVKCLHTSMYRPYTAREIDFIAAYLLPVDTWYLVPVKAIPRNGKFNVFPKIRNSRSKYERYRENWDLLRR